MITREDVINAYRLILGREAESEEVIIHHLSNVCNLSDLRDRFLLSEEFERRISEHITLKLQERSSICSGDITVSHVSHENGSFFATLDSNAEDPVSLSLAKGDLGGIETSLTRLYDKGVFVDLGANVGAFSLYMASKGWSGVAFEASMHNVSLLRKSVILNNFDLTVIDKAVYSHSGLLYFISHGPWGHVFNKKWDETTNSDNRWSEIPCVAIDDLLDSAFKDVEKVNLIKIDIEGSEPAALRGMQAFLKKYNFPPIFMEINAFALFAQQETPLSLMKSLATLGYDAYSINGDDLVEYPSCSFPLITFQDLLFIKDSSEDFSEKIKKITIQTEDDITSWILDKLKNWETWHYSDTYIPYVLKDYPQYAEIPAVDKVLSVIQKSLSDEKISNRRLLQLAMDWYCEESTKHAFE